MTNKRNLNKTTCDENIHLKRTTYDQTQQTTQGNFERKEI